MCKGFIKALFGTIFVVGAPNLSNIGSLMEVTFYLLSFCINQHHTCNHCQCSMKVTSGSFPFESVSAFVVDSFTSMKNHSSTLGVFDARRFYYMFLTT